MNLEQKKVNSTTYGCKAKMISRGLSLTILLIHLTNSQLTLTS